MASLAKMFGHFASQLAQGTPIYKITAPAEIHQKKSGLQIGQLIFFSNGACLKSCNEIEGTEDPVERIGKLMMGLFNVHVDWSPDRPFNPIHGEFYQVEVVLPGPGGEKFSFCNEQLWHAPPVNSFIIEGPTFIASPVAGLDETGGFKLGFNHVEISFPGARILFQSKKTGETILEYSPPPIKLDPIFTGKSTVGLDGDFYILDVKSGMKFQGKVSKMFKIKGDILDKEGNKVDYVEGDLFTGVFFKSSKKMWINGLEKMELEYIIPPEVAEDPMFSLNVWKKVWEAMSQDPPDWKSADQEKNIILERQNATQKEMTAFGGFKSRYGLTCKYMENAT